MFGSVARIDGGTGSDRITLFSPASGVIDGGEDADGLDDDILILNALNTDLTAFSLTGIESLFAGSTLVSGRAMDFIGFSRIAFNDLFPNNPIRLTLLSSGVVTSVDLAAALAAGAPSSVTILGSKDAEAITTAAGNDSVSGAAAMTR